MPSDSGEMSVAIDDAVLEAQHGDPNAAFINCTQLSNGRTMRPGGILIGRHVSDTANDNEESTRHYAHVRGILWKEGRQDVKRYRLAVGQVVPIGFREIHPYRTDGREIRIFGW